MPIPMRSSFRLALLLAAGPVLVAQSQTASLTTAVRDPEGRPVAGARVILTSPALLGSREGTTDAGGTFRAPLLPPGTYTGSVVREGFGTRTFTTVLPLGASLALEVALKREEVAGATVAVLGAATKLSKESVATAENFSQAELVDRLPVARTLQEVALLAPGVTTGAGSRPAFLGAEAYENKFLLDGVDVNDNLFNTPNPLFIEDAIQEHQVLTTHISAEYGRFAGGVVNSILKRGGNTLEGSLRATLLNQSWNAVLPLQNRGGIVSKTTPVYIATVGGPILKDELWFFAAFRSEKRDQSLSLPMTGLAGQEVVDETRGNLALTWAINAAHSLNGSYTFNKRDSNGPALMGITADPNGFMDMKDRQNLASLRYTGLLGTNLAVEVLYTRKRQEWNARDMRGTSFDLSPVISFNGPGIFLYNNHYFGENPEKRDNDSLSPKLTWYFEAAGSHELKAGAEFFKETWVAANRQSPSDFVIWTAVNVTGSQWQYQFIPYDPQTGTGTFAEWWEAPGGTLGSRYTSVFVNDNWKLNTHWNLTLGARYERLRATWEEPGKQLASTDGFMPRLGVNYNPKGDGRLQFQATYGHYLSKLNQFRLGAVTTVGIPILRTYGYSGAAYSTPTNTGAGFQRSGYGADPFLVRDPRLNVFLDPDVRMPLTQETTLGVKRAFGPSGVFTATYIHRLYTRMLENYSGPYGTTVINGLPFWNVYWKNSPDSRFRRYEGVLLTLEDVNGALSYRASYTYSRLRGNYDSEGGNVIGGSTSAGEWDLARPGQDAGIGYLSNDRTHDLHVLASYVLTLGAHRLSFGTRFQFLSGNPYSHSAYGLPSLTGIYAPAPPAGPSIPAYSRTFGGLGAFRFPDTWTLDVSVQWDATLAGKVQPFVKLTLLNALNHPLIRTFNTNGSLAPVLDSQSNVVDYAWQQGAAYGKPSSAFDWMGNRQVQVDLGLKF